MTKVAVFSLWRPREREILRQRSVLFLIVRIKLSRKENVFTGETRFLSSVQLIPPLIKLFPAPFAKNGKQFNFPDINSD